MSAQFQATGLPKRRPGGHWVLITLVAALVAAALGVFLALALS